MSNLWPHLKERKTQYFILLLVLLLFLSQGYNLAIYTIIALVVFYLFDKNLGEKIRNLNFKILIPFWLFFGMQVIGTLYSDNKIAAWREIEIGIPFLLLPIVILTEPISKKYIYNLLLFFKYWLVFFALILVINQVFLEGKSLWTLPFFSLKNLTGIHQLYLSQFYFLILLFVLYQIRKKRLNTYIAIVEILFLLFFILLLSAGPTLFMSVAALLIAFMVGIKNWYLKFVMFSVLFLGIFLARNTLFLKSKIHRLTHIEWNLEDNIKKHQLVFSSEFNAYNTLEMRLIKWHVASEIIKANIWTGVGTGDFQDELNNGYEKIRFNNGIKHKYNTHNQYLEETVKFGIVGLLIILVLFGQHLLLAFKERNTLLFIIIIFIAFSALTESVFARFHGTVFYAVFIPLLYKFYRLKDDQ